MTRPELLMPAGSLQKMRYAFAYGADAVYAGIPFLSLRARENEISLEDLQMGVKYAHNLKKKVYVTINIFGRNTKLKPFEEQLDGLLALNADAFIMSDPGLIAMVKERAPLQEIHLSVQANCMNWKSAEFWHKLGVSRIILSRELRLAEIKKIKEKVPELELEAFVHGSICIAYSGRCLMSHYMSNRDANQGVCDNSCRYPMKMYMKDARNPEELYAVEEDEHGSYIMNAKDLCVLPHLKELQDAGICSFKVEGRTKSIHYVSMVSRIYKKAIDDLAQGKAYDPKLMDELFKIPNRGYHPGFLIQAPDHTAQDYESTPDRAKNSVFLGVGQKSSKEGCVDIEVRNKLNRQQKLEVVSPSGVFQFTADKIINTKGEEVETAHGGTGVFSVPCQKNLDNFSIIRIIK